MSNEKPVAEFAPTETAKHEPVEPTPVEWITPTYDEQSACAEICAYVFTA